MSDFYEGQFWRRAVIVTPHSPYCSFYLSAIFFSPPQPKAARWMKHVEKTRVLRVGVGRVGRVACGSGGLALGGVLLRNMSCSM